MVCPAPPPAPALRPASHRTGSARPDVYAGGRPAPPQATRCARTRSRSRREGPRAVRRRSTRSDPDDDRRRHRDPRSSRGYDPRAQAWHHRARIAPDAPCGPSRAASTRCARSSPGTNRIPVSAAPVLDRRTSTLRTRPRRWQERSDLIPEIIGEKRSGHAKPTLKTSLCTVSLGALNDAHFTSEWRDALWARFFTAAPQRRRRSVERSSIVKRA